MATRTTGHWTHLIPASTYPSLTPHILHLAGRALADGLGSPELDAHARVGDRHGDDGQEVG